MKKGKCYGCNKISKKGDFITKTIDKFKIYICSKCGYFNGNNIFYNEK